MSNGKIIVVGGGLAGLMATINQQKRAFKSIYFYCSCKKVALCLCTGRYQRRC
ncbi:hypothetical protein [Sinobaca sp. H24]|uniref:hypothetical protein n=1 Tax=Sinobaca sp. H24 TaxID=2923376 RepID=UPI00207A9E8B|nr:hypothetical protein [Sinobaca sp. H24]